MITINDNDLPITVAEKLISGTRPAVRTDIEKMAVRAMTGVEPEDQTADMYSMEELQEIADYLRVYCNAHADGD